MEGWKSKSNSSMVRRAGKCANRSRAFEPALAGGGGFLGDQRGQELEAVVAVVPSARPANTSAARCSLR